MFKKLASLLTEEKPKAKTAPVKTKAKSVTKSPGQLEPSDDPAQLVKQAILEAEKTMAMEEKIAGSDPDHLEAVRGAMMIYRQKQESLDNLPLSDKAKLRAMSEAIFGNDLSKAQKNAKKTH